MKGFTQNLLWIIKRGLWVYIAVIFSFIYFIQPVRAEEKKVIRVAYPIQAGLTEIDETGNYRGYTYEYLQEIAQYTGWDYEFVQAPGDINTSLSQLMDMLESGEIDLMGGVLYSDAMNERFDYAGHSYGIVETVLQVLHDDTRDVVINSQVMQKMDIAVISLTGRTMDELKTYCEMNMIDAEYVLCEDDEGQIKAMEEGRADAMVNTSLNYVEGVRNIARFSPKPFYFITAKGNESGLVPMLNSAISNIDRADPYFSTSLNDKYFVAPNDSLLLSDAEVTYIEEMNPLKVGILKNQAPFQYADEKTGGLNGISVDLLKYISKETGLKLKYITVNNTGELYKKLKDGDIDMLAAVNFDYGYAQDNQISMSRPYISAQYILLLNEKSSEENLNDGTLALTTDSLLENQETEEVKLYEDIDECILAVNKGEADYTYVDGYTAQYYINRPEFRNLRLIPQTNSSRELCFGIARKENSQLLSILNKTVLNIQDEKLQAIIYKNTLYKQEFSVIRLLEEYPLTSALIITGFFACIIGILSVNIIQRNRLNRQMSLNLRKHLQVYDLMEDYFFEYDYKKDTLMVSIPAKKEGDQARLNQYDINFPSDNSPLKESGKSFVETIKSSDNKIKEMELLCEDGTYHWMRVAAKTVYDREVPVYAVGKLSIIDEEIREREYLLEQAQRDGLTKILNVTTSRRLIEKNMSEMKEHETSGFLLLDIDNFKSVNDTYGHMRGDQVLYEMAGLLRESFRADDVVGRLGGDEFIVYIKRIATRKALGDKCNILCRKAREIKLDDSHNVSISIGGILVTCKDTYDDVYQRVDAVLYEAKAGGRDQYKIENLSE